MKRACFVCLIQCLTTTFLLPQSNPAPLINQSAIVVSPISASQADPKAQAKILDSYGKLPLSFEANHGQTDAQVKFLSRGAGYTLFLTSDEAVVALSGKKTDTHKAKIEGAAHTFASDMPQSKAGRVLRMKFRNANPAAKVSGMDELAGTSNYFIGNDPAKWRTNVPTYAKVKYEGIYSGIDLVYYGNQRQLEYDFVVAPGANPRRIQFDVRGTKRIRQDGNGELVFKMGEDEIRWHKPVVYQEKNGVRQEIAAHYAITDTNRVGFEIAKYDSGRPLYIDPLIYSTYLGGSDDDFGKAIAVDSAGNAYVTGFTSSTNFPTTPGAFQTTLAGVANAFVTKINPSGSALVYSTYLGGTGADIGSGIAVDSAGNAYLTGHTVSTDFPTVNALQPTFAGGHTDAFVAEINPTGSALIYSTYLGGSGDDIGLGIAVDSAGNAYVTGQTASTNFPTVNPLQPTIGGSEDAFIAKLNPSGSALVYSTYLGGNAQDSANSIALDSSGNVYISGLTASTNFPTMNSLQPTYGGGQYDAFVAKINPTGSALTYSTYLGGSGFDVSSGIAVDSAGNAYVTGQTFSTNFPTTPGAFQTVSGGSGKYCGTILGDAFVTKINPTGSALVYSTYLGGSCYDESSGIAVDSSGDAYVTGGTNSDNFPTTSGALQTTCDDTLCTQEFAFVSEFNPMGSALLYSTYLGGSTWGKCSDCYPYNSAAGIALDSSGGAYVTGMTQSTNFPTMNPLQGYAGGYDAFVSKFSFGIGPPTNIDQCKKDGWKVFTIPWKFKNQGDCVSFVNTGK